EPRWSVEQRVIEGFAALPGRSDRDGEVLADAILSDIVLEPSRPQPGLELRVIINARGCDKAFVGHSAIVVRSPESRVRSAECDVRSSECSWLAGVHVALRTPQSALRTAHPALRTAHPALRTAHPALRTADSALRT